MKFTRRRTLLLGAAAGAAGLGLAAQATQGRGVATHTLDVIREVYGPEFADQPAAAEFAQVYEEFIIAKGLSGRVLNSALRLGVQHLPWIGRTFDRIDDSVIEKFATSTNVIMAAERGEPLVFVALFTPYDAPCMSQLSANAIS